jgi:hypothetical protein
MARYETFQARSVTATPRDSKGATRPLCWLVQVANTKRYDRRPSEW